MPHQAELQSQVRALAHLLAHGQISWADYREQRAGAVRRIVRGDDTLTYDRAVIFDDPTAPTNQSVDQVILDVSEIDAQPRRWPAVIAVGAFLVVAALAGWVIYNVQQPPVTASAPVVERTPGEAMLTDFQELGDWSAAASDNLMDAWRALTPDARAEARATASWRRFQNALRAQINQQAALAAVDESGLAEAEAERLRALRDALAGDQVSSS